MGERLKKAFELAERKGGLALAMRLAMQVEMSKQKAEDLPDTKDQVGKFCGVLKNLGIEGDI